MNLERFDIRIDDQRIVVVEASLERREAIGCAFRGIGLSVLGSSTWLCAQDVSTDELALAIGELAQDECVYVIAQGSERLDLKAIAAPRTRGGITVGGPL